MCGWCATYVAWTSAGRHRYAIITIVLHVLTASLNGIGKHVSPVVGDDRRKYAKLGHGLQVGLRLLVPNRKVALSILYHRVVFKHTEWFHVASKSFGSVGHYPILKHNGNRPIRPYTIKRPLGNHVVTCLRFENGTPS